MKKKRATAISKAVSSWTIAKKALAHKNLELKEKKMQKTDIVNAINIVRNKYGNK